MFPFGFGFVLGVAAAFLTFPDDDCLPDVGAGLFGFVLICAMVEGFEGGGTDGGIASVKGDLVEVEPGDGGRPTSGCFRESRGLRNIGMACSCVSGVGVGVWLSQLSEALVIVGSTIHESYTREHVIARQIVCAKDIQDPSLVSPSSFINTSPKSSAFTFPKSKAGVIYNHAAMRQETSLWKHAFAVTKNGRTWCNFT